MNKNNNRFFRILLPVLTALVFVACNGESDNPDKPVVNPPAPIPAQLEYPMNGDTFFIGDKIDVKIKVNVAEEVNDLAIIVADTVFMANIDPASQTILIPTDDNRVGPFKFILSYTDGKGKKRSDNREIFLFSDIEPDFSIAEIKETFVHAKTSYTQGLEFYKGALFEGTGQYNQSILTEVDLNTGTKLREHELDGSIFGEGITILNDTIYQITYRSQICYVYDMEFNLLNTFNYDGEGWGLCNDGKHIIMSNGSDYISWRDPSTFAVVKKLPVFDDSKSIVGLNELELIKGDLYANIYTENELVKIDTSNGKVLSYIDCSRLVNDAFTPENDVLNGIAYNPITEKIYLTGKLWPKLYEVEFK